MSRSRSRYTDGSRGPVRDIVEHYPGLAGYTVSLTCGHRVTRRRVLDRQRVTTCELCKAIANEGGS